jgi:hypothetical protein
MSDARRDTLALDDEAFSNLYAKRIAPLLSARESERQAALANLHRWQKWLIWGAFAFGVLAAVATQNIIIGIVFGVVAYYALHAGFLKPLAHIASSARAQTLAAVAEATGSSYKADGFEPDAYKPLMALALLPHAQRTRFSDRFAGKHKRCDFAFCKAWLENRREKNDWYPVFEGHLIRIALRKSFNSTVILRRDAGQLENWLESLRIGSSMKRFDLGNADLEQAFEAYTTDDFEAPFIVDKAFLRRLLDLEHKFGGRNLRCAFDQGALLIAVESREPDAARHVESAHFWKRLMIYENYRNEGISVTANKAAEIDAALDEESKPTEHTMDGRLDSITRARAIAGEVTEIMGLIDNILARA